MPINELDEKGESPNRDAVRFKEAAAYVKYAKNTPMRLSNKMSFQDKLRRRLSAVLVFGVAVIASASTSGAQESESKTYRPKVGELHDDFCLPQIGNSKPVSLSDFRGKKVLLMHFASW